MRDLGCGSAERRSRGSSVVAARLTVLFADCFRCRPHNRGQWTGVARSGDSVGEGRQELEAVAGVGERDETFRHTNRMLVRDA